MSAGGRVDGRGLDGRGLDGCVLVEAPWLMSLSVVGDDAVEYLQGRLSCDVAGLAPGQGAHALLLTRQGRVQELLAVYRRADDLLLVVDRGRADSVMAALEEFIVADDVEFESCEQAGSLLLTGQDAPALLAGAASDFSERDLSELNLSGLALNLRRRADLCVPSFELLPGPGSDPAQLSAALEELGASKGEPALLDRMRIESGTPAVGVDVDEQRMAIEARLEWAIHFAKGCYVGQEVIERSVSRGRVNHLLGLLQIDPAGAAVHAAELVGLQVAGGSPADVVTSVSMGAGGDSEAVLALAYLPAAMAETGSVVELERDGVVLARATVVEWPRPHVLAGRQSPA
ncbi:MAG: hypothetical protein H8E45_11080 [Proteobacteria bacterium]|nr:hypothetical protein [Pseudomonadota bacterium]